MEECWENKIRKRLAFLYEDPARAREAWEALSGRLSSYKQAEGNCRESLSEKNTMLITYGDTIFREGEAGLRTLKRFMEEQVGDAISHIHLLPMYPYTSDDGFSVVDFRRINPALGEWKDVRVLSEKYGLMFDAVINHVSRSSEWFRNFQAGIPPYDRYFITCDPSADTSKVVRPRALPLFTEVETAAGRVSVWTTFSEDQIDLNYECPEVLAEILEILVFFGQNGASFIRLDAIAFLWKELGTTCLHHPKTHEVIRLIRDVLSRYAPQVRLITETNVPQEENLSYFGSGDEADLVYQFPLPPLTMYTLLTGDARPLNRWLGTIPEVPGEGTYFNFLSSHDGIGIRPAEGILTEEQKQVLLTAALRNGGKISYKDNGDGTKSPYELNINYQDALASPEESDEVRIGRFLAAETILLSLQGVPGIYIHSLLGSRNDYLGREESGIPRRINRERLEAGRLTEQLQGDSNRGRIFREMIRRLQIRRTCGAFSPQAGQEILQAGDHVIALKRGEKKPLWALINVSGIPQECVIPEMEGRDLLAPGEPAVAGKITLTPYQTCWIWAGEKEC